MNDKCPRASTSPVATAGVAVPLYYTIVTTLSMTAGIFLAAGFTLMLHGISKGTPPLSEQLLQALEGGSLWGLILGSFQQAALRRLVRRLQLAGGKTTLDEIGRRRVRDTAAWTVATVAGTTAGLLICIVAAGAITITPHALQRIAGHALLGAILGTAQWMALRRWAAGAAIWIPCSAAALALSVPVQEHLQLLPLPLLGFQPVIVPGAVMGLFLGSVQALCLMRLAARWKGLQPPQDDELTRQDSET